MTLAERLRRLLDARGSTIAEAAKLAGMPRQQVWRVVSGANDNPEIRTVERIVTAVGGTLAELFSDDEEG
jgi:transcriptional regulator with XRE-family HTH domain